MEIKGNEEIEVNKHALLSPAVKDCTMLKTFLLDFNPVDWRAIFTIVFLGDALGTHIYNPVHFLYANTLKID